jgi:hypothetical protein
LVLTFKRIGKVCLPLFLMCFVAFWFCVFAGLGTWSLWWLTAAALLFVPMVMLCIGAACLSEATCRTDGA